MDDVLPVTEELSTDGRVRKGQQRRQLLLRATMQVIERDGVAAVTQRTVAKRAGLPPSAVMYYFPTIDDLIVATMTACNDGYLRHLAEIADEDTALARLAELIADSAGRRRSQLAAEYELFLMAAHRPELRAEVVRWTQALDDFFARIVVDDAQRAGVTAAVDGLFLRCFCVDEPPTADEILEILRSLTASRT